MSSVRIVGQLAAYGAFALALVLAHAPRYAPVARDEALLQVSLAHAGARLHPCRRLSEVELAARAPNMRAPDECPRGRSAVRIVVELDGRPVVDETVAPSGVARDGTSTLYRRIAVASGSHTLRVRIVDDLRAPERATERLATLRFDPGRVLSVDFRPERGGILIS
jgi:hypothetical protein